MQMPQITHTTDITAHISQIYIDYMYTNTNIHRSYFYENIHWSYIYLYKYALVILVQVYISHMWHKGVVGDACIIS